MEIETFSFGPYELDGKRGVLRRKGLPVAIGHKASILLQALLQADGEAVSKSDLLDAAWPDLNVEESNLTVQIAALRKLLGTPQAGSDWIITVPRFGYRFLEVGRLCDEPSPAAGSLPAENGATHSNSSIAVLPFSNLSGDIEQEYLADGIAEDIITTLTRCRWLFVASRNSGFLYKGRSVDPRQVATDLGVRYVLEGSVRKSADLVRVSAQLVDGSNGRDIWAQRYDLKSGDSFAIQDEIALRAVGAIEPALLDSEAAAAVTRTGTASALDTVRQGTWHFHKVTRDTHFKARDLFRQAQAAEPDLIEANIWLGRVAAGIVAFGWAENRETEIAEGVTASLRAIELDEQNPYAHYSLAISRLYADLPDQAVSAAQRAIEINPSFALGHLVLGNSMLASGASADAATKLAHGLELNANDPQNFIWLNLLAVASFLSGQPERGIAAASRAAQIRPAWRPALESLALCHHAAGNRDNARRIAEQFSGLSKTQSDGSGPLRRFNPEWAALIDGILAKLASQLV